MLSLKLKERQKEWLIKGAFGAGVFAGCFWFMIFPLFGDIALFKQKLADDQERLGLFQDIRALNEKVSSLEASLATSTDRSLMLGKISDVATKTHIDMQSLTPKTSKEGVYINLKIDMKATGNFLALLDFLRAVEVLRPPVMARDLTLASNRSEDHFAKTGKGDETLDIKFVLETYLKQPREKKNL